MQRIYLDPDTGLSVYVDTAQTGPGRIFEQTREALKRAESEAKSLRVELEEARLEIERLRTRIQKPTRPRPRKRRTP